MNKMKYILYTLSIVLLSSCAEQTIETTSEQRQLPILLSATYPVLSQTRVTDNGFVADDEVGVFIVDYDEEGNPGEPTIKGNRGSNVRFTYDGSKWSAPYQIYWADGKTPADFYGYYPFDEAMNSVTEYAFNIQSNQNISATETTKSGYEQSDLLWAKAEKMMPTATTIDMTYKHLMAGVTVTLTKGTGFTDEMWNSIEKIVQIDNTVLNGVVNIKTGEVTANSQSVKAITPLSYNGIWRAVTYPQTVDAGKSLISVTIDGMAYKLTQATSMIYQSGKMHNFTLEVNCKSGGEYSLTLKNEAISAWVDDADLHDGLVRQYTIVEVTTPGTLQQVIADAGLEYERVMSLKVKGTINETDMNFMGQQMKSLANVNLQHATITDGVVRGFSGHTRLKHFVFPEKGVTKIENQAFMATSLTGSLVIPEGVEHIGEQAYANIYFLKGSLTLPSTMKRVEQAAFSLAGLTGELRIPEGVEFMESATFFNCDFEGNLYLPESLTSLPGMEFPNVTGSISIPRNITVLRENLFKGCGLNEVVFHDGIEEIRGFAFANTQLSGELVLPPNLKKLGGAAFINTKITNVIFPDALRIMSDGGYDREGIFANNTRITGTVQFAKNVARVPKGCFYNCTAMTGIVLPQNVEIIDSRAFENCYSLNSIVCENPEPPLVCADAFYGVPKDNFTLEVPEGSVDKYKNAEGWSEFKRIAEYSNFVCRPSQANALNNTHSEKLILNADGEWKVKSCPNWCTLSEQSGNGKTELNLIFSELGQSSQHRKDTIWFEMPTGGYITYCVVSQYNYAYEEDSYITLQTHEKGNGIKILFIGDGFDGEDISNGSYLDLVKQQVEHFFGVEPYKSHRKYFDVYAAFPLSQEKGVNTMNTYVNNRFGTLYGYDGTICTTNQLLVETAEVYDYVTEHSLLTKEDMKRSLVILVPNSSEYTGVTIYADQDLTLSICPPSERSYPRDMRGVVQHEAGGHGFGKLGDEEIKYTQWAPVGVLRDIEDKHRYGWWRNLSATSKMSDVPWADFIFDERYSDEVDVYEGGAGYMRGVFRSESNSCMNYGIPYYNVASRYSIMKLIFEYSGEVFTDKYFYANDSKEWGETASRGTVSEGTSYGKSSLHKPPVWVDMQQMDLSIKTIRKQNKDKREQSFYR